MIPAKAVLYGSGGQTVYTQNVRLNALAVPDNLSPGQYNLYVNGAYKDSLQVSGPANKNQDTEQSVSQAQTPSSRVEVENVNGVQAITWNEKPTQIFSFSLGDNLIFKRLAGQFTLWLKQERVFWAGINVAFFMGAILVAVAIITFHATALSSSTVRPLDGWLEFFQSGWRYFPYTIVSAIIWFVALVGVTTLIRIAANLFQLPFKGNLDAGVIAFAVAFLLGRIASIVTGRMRKGVEFLSALIPGILAAALAFYPVIPTVFMAVLILLVPAVTGSIGGVRTVEGLSGEIMDLSEPDPEDPEYQAWRETLQ